MKRKSNLIELNPTWVYGRYRSDEGGPARGIKFDCPEGHVDCWHTIPFTPALDGLVSPGWQENGAIWHRSGDTFETLTLTPSIRRVPQYSSKEEAVAHGCIAEYVTEDFLCAFHGFIKNGTIEFCGDSR